MQQHQQHIPHIDRLYISCFARRAPPRDGAGGRSCASGTSGALRPWSPCPARCALATFYRHDVARRTAELHRALTSRDERGLEAALEMADAALGGEAVFGQGVEARPVYCNSCGEYCVCAPAHIFMFCLSSKHQLHQLAGSSCGTFLITDLILLFCALCC